MSSTPNFTINAFYESKFTDSLFVIKAGGKIIEDAKALDNLISNIRELTIIGVKVLLVYGGGNAMDAEAEARGITVQKHEGRRVTDQASMDLMAEIVGGRLSLAVTSSMARHDLHGLSFNAVPPKWMSVELRDKTPVDFGFVGDIHSVSKRAVERIFKSTDFAACACLATTKDGTLCNINADTIATQIAIATGASKLVFLSDVDGVSINDAVQSLMTAEEIPTHIKSGDVTGGMQVKLENCADALKLGVRRIHLINGFRDDALKHEIFEPEGPGTMLILDSERNSYMNEIQAQSVIEKKRA
jgi:acetylglutamate kinase